MARRVGLPGYRWLLFLALVAAVSVWGWPGEADASVTAFEITSFNLYTNSIGITFSTSRVVNCDDSTGSPQSRNVYLESANTSNPGQSIRVFYFTDAALDSGGGCPALTDQTASTGAYTQHGYGGSQTLWLKQGSPGNASDSDTYTFPSKVQITSASVADGVLSLAWTSPTTDATADYHYVISTSSSLSDRFAV